MTVKDLKAELEKLPAECDMWTILADASNYAKLQDEFGEDSELVGYINYVKQLKAEFVVLLTPQR